MADRPILFSAQMVRALLDGRKTQTRRVMPAQPSAPLKAGDLVPAYEPAMVGDVRWPLGPSRSVVSNAPGPHSAWVAQHLRYAVGDRIWVKEAFRIGIDADEKDALDPYLNPDRFIIYNPPDGQDDDYIVPVSYQPPRTSERSRYTHFSGKYDAWTEMGSISPRFMPRWASRLTLVVTDVHVERLRDISEDDAKAEGVRLMNDGSGVFVGREGPARFVTPWPTAREAFLDIWNTLHGANADRGNPWVAAISFTVHRSNIDDMAADALEIAGAA